MLWQAEKYLSYLLYLNLKRILFFGDRRLNHTKSGLDTPLKNTKLPR